jgi:hypothetical protein
MIHVAAFCLIVWFVIANLDLVWWIVKIVGVAALFVCGLVLLWLLIILKH